MKPLSLLLSIIVFLTSGLISVADAQVVNSQHRDIGAVAVAGSAANNGSGGFTGTGAGGGNWGPAAEIHFVYFSLCGGSEIVVRVTGGGRTDGWVTAGL